MQRSVREWMEAELSAWRRALTTSRSPIRDTDELVALARVVAEFGGTYSAHGRHIGFGRRRGDSARPLEVGRRAASARTSPTSASTTRSRRCSLEAPAATSDSHLYEAGSTDLIYYVPFEDEVGGPAAVLERLRRPYAGRSAARLDDSLRQEPAAVDAFFSASRSGQHIGRTIAEIANEWHLSAGEAIVRLLREELPEALMVYPWGPTEEEFRPTVAATLRHGRVMVSSDGVYHGPLPHPRGFGTFPRAIRVGVRELGAVSLEEAIHRMTWLPASRYELSDRGRVAVGSAADLVVFDPETFADRRPTWSRASRRSASTRSSSTANGSSRVAS